MVSPRVAGGALASGAFSEILAELGAQRRNGVTSLASRNANVIVQGGILFSLPQGS
jgi:hypothetical protein